MSDITGFFSYLKVMLWLAQDLLSNCTQTGTAAVSSPAGMVQVMLLSVRLVGHRGSCRELQAAAWPRHPDRQLAATWQGAPSAMPTSRSSGLLRAAPSSAPAAGPVHTEGKGRQGMPCQHAAVPPIKALALPDFLGDNSNLPNA